jgi:hypothetical protein
MISNVSQTKDSTVIQTVIKLLKLKITKKKSFKTII